MKLLSIDTSSNICGVSILENTNLICTLDNNTGKTHSENLMPMIKEILNKTNLTLEDIDLIVYDKGPGSFTGLRIGIATVKAFGDSMNLKCIGISSLEALAYNVKTEGLICSIIDCKNNNCYFSLYELKNNIYKELIPPTVESFDNTIKILNKFTNLPITFVGSGVNIFNFQNIFQKAILSTDTNNTLNSYHLGLAGFYKYISSNTLETTDNILPLYLKKPQAEINFKKKD